MEGSACGPSKRPRYGPLSGPDTFQRFENFIGLANFNPDELTLAPADTNFNDNLRIPHYERNNSSISGKQRRGIAQTIGPVPNYFVHVERAASEISPLSLATPLTKDLEYALDLVAFAPERQIRDFWLEQLRVFRDLADLTKSIAHEWYNHTPEPIKPAVGLINAPLFAALISMMDIGDPAWVSQFVHGFPITGF